MTVTYNNLSGPRETGYDPGYETGFVAYSPNNDKTYVRQIPPESNIAAGAVDTEGAIQIIEADGINKTIVKLQPFLQAAYEQEADYDSSITLQINGGTFVDPTMYFDNTGYMYVHVRTSNTFVTSYGGGGSPGVIPRHYLMTSKDGGLTWSAYRLPNGEFMIMENNSRPIR